MGIPSEGVRLGDIERAAVYFVNLSPWVAFDAFSVDQKLRSKVRESFAYEYSIRTIGFEDAGERLCNLDESRVQGETSAIPSARHHITQMLDLSNK